MSAPPAGKLPKDYDKLPVPQPQATSARKREPKMLAVIDPGKCFSGAVASSAWRCARSPSASPSPPTPRPPT